jgi:sugar/nucleoside kinase (ribokinase family)
MKKYQVFGIGNALVDMEFEVSDSFFTEHGIEKGLMTLVDEDTQHRMVGTLTSEYGLIKRAGGGSAANTVVAISQFGGNTFYACKVADDEAGDFYMHDLHAAGVSTRLDQVKGEGVTGKCMVMVTPDAERTMNTFLGITADFAESDLHLEELEQAEYLYIEGYLVTSDISRSAAMRAREHASKHGVKTAFTFSDPAMVTYFRDGVKEILADGVDVLFCNEEEAQIFTGTDTLESAIATLKPYAERLIVTRGPRGAVILNGNERIEIEVSPVEAVDTNGAGDMFAGAFMYGLTNGLSDRDAGMLASEAAARTVATFGARLPMTVHQELLTQFES